MNRKLEIASVKKDIERMQILINNTRRTIRTYEDDMHEFLTEINRLKRELYALEVRRE